METNPIGPQSPVNNPAPMSPLPTNSPTSNGGGNSKVLIWLLILLLLLLLIIVGWWLISSYQQSNQANESSQVPFTQETDDTPQINDANDLDAAERFLEDVDLDNELNTSQFDSVLE